MMDEVDRIIACASEAMANAADKAAETLEASESKLTGAQALRSFANALRDTAHPDGRVRGLGAARQRRGSGRGASAAQPLGRLHQVA